ncbi:MAG: hypothetical protein ACE37H_06270 [Phycisphaeraceae bacterium]
MANNHQTHDASGFSQADTERVERMQQAYAQMTAAMQRLDGGMARLGNVIRTAHQEGWHIKAD